MSKILKRTSFGLLRTNPKLTTNIKIIADSQDKIYLESFDADPLLSKSIYKGYQVSSEGSFSFDLKRFYSQTGGSIPKGIAYMLFEEDDSTQIKDRYKNQFDFTYGYGFFPKNSRIYSEEFSMFAPLWIEKDNIPDYFLIFKMDDPAAVNINDPSIISSIGATANFDTAVGLNDLVVNPSLFFENFIEKARIIKTFDLTNRTSIGRYIRNHVNDERFPESSIYANLEKGNLTNWQGISFDEGGFCKIPNDIYKDYVLVDKTVTESDDFITSGFMRNGVVCANILNIEFLFDDLEQEKYKFSRYFGLYINEVELGKFILDSKRLYEDKDNEITQTPRPIDSKIGDPSNVTSQIQQNDRGIKVYPHVEFKNGSTAPYDGRLITYSEIQNPRFAYVKDREGNFYSIDSAVDWATTFVYAPTGPTSNPYSIVDTDYLRLKNKKIDWQTFTGYDSPFQYIPSFETSQRGRPCASFEVTGSITVGDEIRIRYTDWNDPNQTSFIDFFTLDANNAIPAGNANGLSFSSLGTKNEIAKSISLAINNIQQYTGEYQIFSSISKGSTVYIFSRTDSETWNKLKFSLFSASPTFPFKSWNDYVSPIQQIYQPSPISSSPAQFGWLYEDNLAGGNNNPSSRVIIEKRYINEFRSDEDLIFVKTTEGFDTTGPYGLYTDKPILNKTGDIVDFIDIDKYYVVNLSNKNKKIDLGSSKKIGLYKYAKNSNGYLSILPIRDFDFDFHSEEYNKSADSDVNKLYNWYLGPSSTWTDTQPVFDPILIGTTGLNAINSLCGPTSAFVVNGGFQNLIGLVDEFQDITTEVTNEYSRLKENDIPELALSSRVVPFINKWVYDNESVDVRENGYRLNTDQTFGHSNFSPSFDEFSSNPKFYTEEWLYLQKYPPYMSFDEKLKSYSYFDEDIYFPNLPIVGSTGSTSFFGGLTGATGASANLLSIVEDYFVSYFTRETIGGSAISRDFKYSIFEYGDDVKFSETLFRGVKVLIKDRSEFSTINYNIESLRFLPNSKYNGYKFSAILTYSETGTNITFIKNEKFKTVTLIIQANLSNALLQYFDRDPITGATGATHSFIDRSSLYTLKDKYEITPSGTFAYQNVPLSGVIGDGIWYWEDLGTSVGFLVHGGIDSIGNSPSFITQITQNETGAFCSVRVLDPSNPISDFTFNNITHIDTNSFICQQILGPGFGSITPGAGNSLSADLTINPALPILWNPLSYALYVTAFSINPFVVGGGYNAYVQVLEDLSFASIANKINLGDPNIKYLTVTESGEVNSNQYVIELSKPDYPFKGSYLKAEALKKKPVDLQNSADVIGFELTADTSMTISQIARNRGGYNPKWRDVIRFIDTDDIKNEGLSYFNIQILTDVGYLKDFNLGLIENQYFNKVNVENPNVILRATTFRERSIYPLIGEIAIDYSNFFIFRSNWDPFYFFKYNRRNTRSEVIGTREPKEEKSFFASKAIAIPNGVRLETFPSGIRSESRLPVLNSFINTGNSIAEVINQSRNGRTLTARVFTTIALQDYLIADGIGEEFDKWVNPNYSFGNPNLDDDVKLYISENIVDRYSIKEIILWEKFWERGNSLPRIETGLTDIQKIQAGYVRSKNFKAVPLSTGNLNFDLIYSIPADRNFSIAFTVVLEKK